MMQSVIIQRPSKSTQMTPMDITIEDYHMIVLTNLMMQSVIIQKPSKSTQITQMHITIEDLHIIV